MRTLSIAAILVISTAAHAEPRITTLAPTCAQVDSAAYGDEAARERTRAVLARVLEQADVFVVDRDCAETYRVAVRDEMIELAGPRTTVREARSSDLGTQLGEMIGRERAYREPVATPAPVATPTPADPDDHPDVATTEAPANDEVDAQAEPEAQEAPPPVKMLVYGRWGLGGTAGLDGGQAFGLGLRTTLSKADLDLSVGAGSNQTFLKVEMLTTPAANQAGGYVGGGLSVSGIHGADQSGAEQSGSGLGAELSAGYAVTESHRWFVQADASVPFYTAETTYPITFAISLGYAFVKR